MADTKIKGMGALPSPIDIRDYKATCVAKAADFPEEFELYRPPVKNQGSVSACHDDQTEVLTREGWKFFKDITYEDKLASVNPEDGQLIFEHPTDILCYDYDGSMVVGRHMHGLDFKVTPNHNMVVQTWIEKDRKLSDDYKFVRAEDLGWYARFMTKFHHITGEEAGFIVLEEEKVANGNILPRMEIDMHLWVQFLGIYLAEGCFDQNGEKYHHRIQLAAVKKRERNYIKQLLTDMGLHVGDCYKDRFFIFNKRIRQKLVDYGLLGVKSYNKFVPDFIFDLDETYIKEFLYGFAMGDGYFNKMGNVVYSTSSPRLAEQIQILCLMSGSMTGCLSRPPKEGGYIKGRQITTKHTGYIVYTRKRGLSFESARNKSVEHYSGKVYCATVPTYHTLITKRNGCILLSGNCVAHSLSSVVEYFNHEQEGAYMKMSTAYIYGNRYGSTYVGEGMYTSQALKNLVKFGDCPDTWFTGNYEVPTAIEKFKEIAGSIPGDATYPNRISSYFNLKTTNDIKASLMENGPVVIATTWYNGTKCVDGILQFHEETGSSGRHCMFIYGWNKLGWLVGNSWGTNWGKKGNCIIPFDHQISEVWGVSDNVLSEDKKDALIADLRLRLSDAQNKYAETQERLDESLERIIELTKEVEELTRKLGEVDPGNQDLTEVIEQFKKELAQAQEEIQRTKEETIELKKVKEQYEKQIADYEAEIKALNEKLLEYDQPFNSKLGQFIAKIINFIVNLFAKKKD